METIRAVEARRRMTHQRIMSETPPTAHPKEIIPQAATKPTAK